MESNQYASVGKRFVAIILDGVIAGALGIIAGHIIPVLGGIVLWFFYAPVLESSELRATLGKYVMEIQVVDLNGQRLSLRAAVVRNLMKIVSGAILLIGYLMVFFTGKKQTLHDLVAETVVVNGKSTMAIADAWIANVKEIFGGTKTAFGAPEDTNIKSESVAAELEKLQVLREKGALTDAEFEAAKAKILNR